MRLIEEKQMENLQFIYYHQKSNTSAMKKKIQEEKRKFRQFSDCNFCWTFIHPK